MDYLSLNVFFSPVFPLPCSIYIPFIRIRQKIWKPVDVRQVRPLLPPQSRHHRKSSGVLLKLSY